MSNVVVLMNITQELFTQILVEVSAMKPYVCVDGSGFEGSVGQAKFTLSSNEDAERLLRQFEGR